jgi:PPOX class probable F420-dependent enzyme
MASVDRIEVFLSERHNVILAGIRRDGRPHLTPTFFLWDGEQFYVSTTRSRAKYAIFRRDARAEMVVDDPASLRAVLVSGTVEVREDIAAELARFRAIKEKYGLAMPSEAEDLRSHIDEGRVLLAITPDGPPPTWVVWGLD